ncbi:YpiF family protein [Anoxybacteroides amylolyticum]|uniref:DUF2487 family protein n=1 Tax=Anoxybacteroides amylolyticum TaxID=294699 RepID=A0A167T228_9BACL|nr:YpiF family protein [Anoxybacillus amylolyticus]ANB59331.1 hypothetical protein GFC30_2387 [Anoxybacillus amylolyticus]
MKWTAYDVSMYEKEKQYIDTAVLPLLPLTFSERAKLAAADGEFMQLVTNEIERQLKGRLFLFPSFPYFASETLDVCVERLNCWTTELKEAGMRHVFYVTTDQKWKEKESMLTGVLFFLPSIPFEHMDDSYKQQIVYEQTTKLLNAFISHWV